MRAKFMSLPECSTAEVAGTTCCNDNTDIQLSIHLVGIDGACDLSLGGTRKYYLGAMTTPARRRRTVLLFGKTGDGKSTLANMLTTGAIDGDFASGDSFSSLTKQTNFRISTCTNWTIIDTVGLFATDNSEHDLQRTLELRNNLAETHPSIDVFCYVKRASKFTRADEQCWRAFHALFAHNGENPHYHDNVLLVFTSCKRKEWLDENLSFIREMMAPLVVPNLNSRDEIAVPIVEDIDKGRPRYRSIGVDFPPHDEDSVVESKLEKSRSESLSKLKFAIEEVELPLPLCKLPAVEPVYGSWTPCVVKFVGVCCIVCALLVICLKYAQNED